MTMKPDPAKIEGKKVETHEFVHSVSHTVNWSHVLGFLVLLVGVWRLGPVVAQVVGGSTRTED